MLIVLNDRLFFLLNATAEPDPLIVSIAEIAAAWLVFAAAALMPALWIRGRRSARGALIATFLGVVAAMAANQLLGLLWFEPRPFMAGIGHTLMHHAPENSFPSDHATFLWSLGLGLIATGASRRWGIVVSCLGLLVAWARIYLGLHFPIDMAASFLVACAAAALARAAHPAGERWLLPLAEKAYDSVIRALHLPPALFPHDRRR
jgi:undecaprenyl-diphosphatase